MKISKTPQEAQFTLSRWERQLDRIYMLQRLLISSLIHVQDIKFDNDSDGMFDTVSQALGCQHLAEEIQAKIATLAEEVYEEVDEEMRAVARAKGGGSKRNGKLVRRWHDRVVCDRTVCCNRN